MNLMNLIVSRLKEPSTWRGLVMIATALGVALDPQMVEAIVAAGTGLAGLIGVLTTDNKASATVTEAKSE